MKSGFKDQLKSALTAVTQHAVTGAKELGKFVQQEALGAQCLLEYSVGAQVASAGSGTAVWKVYTARSKKEGSPNPVVSAWVLDKRELTTAEEQLYGGGGSGGGGGGRGATLTRPSQRRLEQFVEQCKRDVHHLARLKHPCVLRLVAPLEETRTQLVFITEPVFASLADLLGGGGSSGAGSGGGGGGGMGVSMLPPQLAQEWRQLQLSELEIKHGLLQLADGLHFLHSEAGLVHRGISPASILITQSGAWKLAGFGFAAALDFRDPGAGAGAGRQAFDYSERDPSLLQQALQPPLPYVAPELVASGTTVITGAADVFSLGCVAFELLARQQLLPVRHSLADYESRVHSLTLVDMSGIPMEFQQTLRQMVAPVAGARPPAAGVAGCQYFQADVLLRALKFLDTMIQRDSMQKAAFLRDLPTMCARFDSRVLRYKVLPPLLQELRDVQLQPTLLPIVLRIVQQQEPTEFVDATLPALKPLLASASGETLLLLVQSTEQLAKCMPAAVAAQVLPALLVRAAEHGDVRAQEEMLKRVAAMADSLDYEGLKKAVLPAVHALCLRTTSASVRVSSFAAMSRLVQRMDQAEAENMLQTAAQVTSVDKSAPTAMCVLALGGALAKQWGPRLAAERVLPALAPLLVAPTLNQQQFGIAMKTVRDVLNEVEKSRAGGGASGAPAGSAGAAAPAGAANGSMAAAGGRQGGGLAGVAAAAPAPTDWMAATAVGPTSTTSSGGGSGGGGTSLAAPWSAAPAAAPAGPGAFTASDDSLLAGLQLQGGSNGAAGSSSTFGLAGRQVGSGKPLGGGLSPSSATAAVHQQQQPNWAAFAAPSNSSGPGGTASMHPVQQQQQHYSSPTASGLGASSTAFFGGSSSSQGAGSAAAALADPFAGLQLGGAAAGSSGGSGSNVQWLAAAPAASAGGPSASMFDPFSLGSNGPAATTGTGTGTSGGFGQWPQQQAPRPGGSSGFAQGMDSLI